MLLYCPGAGPRFCCWTAVGVTTATFSSSLVALLFRYLPPDMDNFAAVADKDREDARMQRQTLMPRPLHQVQAVAVVDSGRDLPQPCWVQGWEEKERSSQRCGSC